MKGYLVFFLLLLTFIGKVLAQTTPAKQPEALPFRDVSGIVKDEKDNPVPGAVVHLKSPLDSVYTTTNANGVFIFKQVKRAGFYITVSGQGIPTTTKLYRNSDVAKQIVLDPFELKPPKPIELKEVTVNGAPTIIYKQDTVEYRASDYKVRDGDTLDQLLKKMEGFEVGRDGSLIYQGQEVKKARLNGKDFLGGNVAQVIQNLPAEIIEKAQVIDDYGEQAARTGIKNTEPTKTLNVTTKPDKSIGTYVNVQAQGGNNDRYNTNLTLTHVNANRQIGLTGRVNNTQTGVSNGVNGGGGAGTTFSAYPTVSWSDQWGKFKLTSSYNYSFTDNNSINKSFGEIYSQSPLDNKIQTSYFTRDNTVKNVNEGHRGTARFNFDLDKSNSFFIEPTFNYTSGKVNNTSMDDRINNFVTGFEHLLMNGTSSDNNTNTSLGVNALYQHFFKKPRRNFSMQVGIINSDATADGRKFTTYSFFADQTKNNRLKPDSVANLQTRRTNKNTTYNASLTYLEPLGAKSQLELTGRVNRQVIDNVAKQDTVLANGQLKELARLSNIFNYAFTETRAQLNYTYTTSKFNFSVGGTLLPSTLTGTRVNNNNNQTVSAAISNFRVIPVFRFSYIWSTSQRLNITYTGVNTLPDFTQIQPFTDRSDPIYITTGNPNLKPSFTNTINASYNNYIANSKFTINFTVIASQFKSRVVSNVIQRSELITAPDKYRTIYETTYVNMDGSNGLNVNYTLGKQLADRRYNLSLNGSVSYNYNVAMSNNVPYHTTVWRVNQRFGPKINPNDNIEINPYVAYDVQRTFTSTGANPSIRQTTSIALDGMFYLGNWRLRYNASKNFVTGLGSLNTNPLVINAGVERQLAKKNNLYLTFDVFDILKQNNFVQQTVTPQGVTNTLSNALSRYFMIGLRANFQKWGGKPQRNGKDLKRKGDGSFIY
ncbi:TonB-dependent receptor [Mucilaginibacter auburnensis]|uniref:Carboxypeptidase family protein n=1 Tax=Mucilaginibacter auburnensis TaxID=1457233 RepID=A0A2H9VUA1_9SPHI|nr:TonB-dependent receptor [Mucilaginibacter auburnensis]PJJ84397.1 carboxypeptidase family protein [Mucilaginibacter auburnensis]